MALQRRTNLTLKQRYEIAALFARNISQKETVRRCDALQAGTSESMIGQHYASN